MLLRSPEESLELGRRLAGLARPGDVIALSGPLGAGKTSIARGLLAAEHGRVWAENRREGGARFSIVVPAESRAALASEDP